MLASKKYYHCDPKGGKRKVEDDGYKIIIPSRRMELYCFEQEWVTVLLRQMGQILRSFCKHDEDSDTKCCLNKDYPIHHEQDRTFSEEELSVGNDM